ncbi:LysR family transcriptional regulator [Salipiger sp. P9]|uniref:LysR family transcriptional regulator n=1 Tax=Salipiger pentaromativorans TaxID=2943193 RepID=UPI0021570FD2|nr:LysR family transcriptional regulator [Salipiger pentaromativorans]MCR8547528.1 LysR family transcriptional regulator [Salipiger pentaromativorans]
MNEKQLQQFVRITEAGSISGAAAMIGIDQPSLSRNLRALEQNIGAQLFYRNGRGVRLTSSGEEFLGIARDFLDELDRLRSRVNVASKELQGTISIGAVQFLGENFVPQCLARFKEKHKNVTLQVTGGGSGIIQEMLLSGRIDLGLLYDAGLSSELLAEVVLTDRVVLLGNAEAARAHGIADCGRIPLSRLHGLPLISASRAHGLRRALDAAARRHGTALNVVYEIDSLVTARTLALKGEAFAVLPFGSLTNYLTLPDAFGAAIVEPDLTVSFSLVSPRNRQLEKGALELATIIRRQIQTYRRDLDTLMRTHGIA